MGAEFGFPVGIVVTHGIVFDPGAGLGASGSGRREAPAGLIVAMRPDVFLALSTPLPQPRPSLGWIAAQLRAGRPICPGRLHVWLPGPGRQGTPAVVAHDGRHRAMALRDLLGDTEVPVQLDLPTLAPDAPMPPGIVALLRRGMRAQGGQRVWVPGPLFGATSEDAGQEPAIQRTAGSVRVRAPPHVTTATSRRELSRCRPVMGAVAGRPPVRSARRMQPQTVPRQVLSRLAMGHIRRRRARGTVHGSNAAWIGGSAGLGT